ncbi:MBL fold metallo-hydrolase [Aneurinibacillus tyrosinisolvens]|uniref:MBL fold metallo-hydrolase n=1 Tax=Aneurinibacillus tyrosinisolvens TaxID=1443435 RepID=UPI00063F7290|nr:MBL fold metallo-hydrolase [Aneurinibacillus tyrosinisolvens]
MEYRYKFDSALLKEIQETNVKDGTVAIWNLGQEGYAFKGEREVLYIDLYLSDSIVEDELGPEGLFTRDFPPPLNPSKIENANYVLCSHFHQDHMDHATLRPLAKSSTDALFLVPASHTFLLQKMEIPESRIIGAKHLQSVQLGEFLITPIAVYHPVDEVDSQGNHFYFSFVIQVNGVTIFHSGDTIYFPGLVEELSKFKIDVAFINSNGRDWMRDQNEVIGNMNYREAVEFGRAIHADMLVPMHFDMFKTNRENPAYFVDYLFSTHRNMKFHIFTVGERFIYHT